MDQNRNGKVRVEWCPSHIAGCRIPHFRWKYNNPEGKDGIMTSRSEVAVLLLKKNIRKRKKNFTGRQCYNYKQSIIAKNIPLKICQLNNRALVRRFEGKKMITEGRISVLIFMDFEIQLNN